MTGPHAAPEPRQPKQSAQERLIEAYNNALKSEPGETAGAFLQNGIYSELIRNDDDLPASPDRDTLKNRKADRLVECTKVWKKLAPELSNGVKEALRSTLVALVHHPKPDTPDPFDSWSKLKSSDKAPEWVSPLAGISRQLWEHLKARPDDRPHEAKSLLIEALSNAKSDPHGTKAQEALDRFLNPGVAPADGTGIEPTAAPAPLLPRTQEVVLVDNTLRFKLEKLQGASGAASFSLENADESARQRWEEALQKARAEAEEEFSGDLTRTAAFRELCESAVLHSLSNVSIGTGGSLHLTRLTTGAKLSHISCENARLVVKSENRVDIWNVSARGSIVELDTKDLCAKTLQLDGSSVLCGKVAGFIDLSDQAEKSLACYAADCDLTEAEFRFGSRKPNEVCRGLRVSIAKINPAFFAPGKNARELTKAELDEHREALNKHFSPERCKALLLSSIRPLGLELKELATPKYPDWVNESALPEGATLPPATGPALLLETLIGNAADSNEIVKVEAIIPTAPLGVPYAIGKMTLAPSTTEGSAVPSVEPVPHSKHALDRYLLVYSIVEAEREIQEEWLRLKAKKRREAESKAPPAPPPAPTSAPAGAVPHTPIVEGSGVLEIG